MAYGVELADRISMLLADEPGLSHKRMFGGLAFLLDGRMAVCAGGDGGLMVRIDPTTNESLVAEMHVQSFAMRGRPMAGWLRVDVEGLGTDEELLRWVGHGIAYARTLPPR